MPASTRRAFLVTGGALIVGFSLSGAAGRAAARGGSEGGRSLSPEDVDAFLAIGGDGAVTIFTGKVDLGTGTRTALRQMVAEELGVAFEQVKLIEGDTALTPDQGPTWRSLTIQVGGVQIRQAAATARWALVDLGAQKLRAAPAKLEVRHGVVRLKADPTSGVSYGELVGDRELRLKVDRAAPLKKVAEYTIVGRSVPRVDLPAKATGEWTYVHDVRVPGMVHARVVRPPALGATLQSVDESSVAGVRGLIKIVRVKDFLAVVADTEWGAVRAAERLRATWSTWVGLPEMDKLYEHVRRTPVSTDEVTIDRGDPSVALASAARTLQATYEFPIHTHGSIGPSCAVAEWRGGKLSVWTASQAVHWLRRDLSMTFGVPLGSVHVIYADGAGCYGRNGHEDAAADAALIAREVGRPVRVQWMRHDEHGWDPKGPPTVIDLRAGLDRVGAVVAWRSELWIPKAIITQSPTLIAAELAGLPRKDDINPGNVFQNSAPPYTFPNAHTVCHRLESTPFRPSWIRTPGCLQNTYANEAFMDELAAAAGADPIEFRLRHLADPRGIEVLKAAARRAGWQWRPSPGKPAGPAVGRGVAYVRYENARTYVAAVAEVEVDRVSGVIACRRFVVAHDCGLVINPDGVRAQIEGGVVQTVSRTLKEELKWDRSRVTSIDWASYPILTFPEAPQIEIELLDRPGEPPWGAGEPAAAVVPAAISNAVFDATGIRLRTAPYTPDRVKAALRT